MTSRVKDRDGRSTRWSEHRESRRAELVAAAVAAIDAHGPSASIAEIAASAGVSKPVLYRYFADKDDLYRAVGRWGAEQVMNALVPTLLADDPMRDKVYRACDEYLALLAEHPQVFLLLIEHRSADDPLADGKEQIATSLAKLMGDTLRRLGVDAAGAEPWAHGVIGMGLAVGEWWLRRNIMPLERLQRLRRRPRRRAGRRRPAASGAQQDGEQSIRDQAPSPTEGRVMVSTGSTTDVDAPAEEYVGPALVSTGSTTAATGEIAVDVHLRGHFEPLDGRFHWYGRIAASAELTERVRSGATVTLTTSEGLRSEHPPRRSTCEVRNHPRQYIGTLCKVDP